jgi:hypothetical protein
MSKVYTTLRYSGGYFGSKNQSICPTTEGNKVLEKPSRFIWRWGK